MQYSDNRERFDEAREQLAEELRKCNSIDEVKGGGKQVDIVVEDQSNREFGPSDSWDSDTSNENFTADEPACVTKAVEEGLMHFDGINCVVYDQGEGKGDRDFAIWFDYHIHPEVIEDTDLRSFFRDFQIDWPV